MSPLPIAGVVVLKVIRAAVKGRPMRISSLVGAGGFEPPTSWSRTKRATKLRYAPTEAGAA